MLFFRAVELHPPNDGAVRGRRHQPPGDGAPQAFGRQAHSRYQCRPGDSAGHHVEHDDYDGDRRHSPAVVE